MMICHRALVLALCVVVFGATMPNLVQGQLDPAKELLIDQLAQNTFIPSQNVTGLGLSIVQNDRVVYSKGFGHANIENNVVATNSTLFSIGSTTKGFGATIIVKVLSEKWPELGESVLDTPIIQLAPGYNFTLSDRYRGQSATFRDLLSHRTCLRSPDFDLLFSPVSRAEYSFRTRYQREVCTFRNGWVYNNAMYALVGELIAHINGSTIEQMAIDFARQIGMNGATYFDSDEAYLDNPNMPTAYYRRNDQTYVYDTKLLTRVHIGLTAGGLLASATDMAAYINFHLNEGRVGAVQVIPANVMAWLYTISSPKDFLAKQSEADRLILNYGYGLGFDLQLFDGYKVVNHGGYWPPFMTGMTFMPARKTGIFSSTNGPGALVYGMTHDGLHAAIYDIIFDQLTDLNPSSLEKYYTTSKVGSSESIALNELNQFKNPMTNEDKELLEELRKTNGIRKRIDPEQVIGSYGNANSGEMEILINPQEGWLQVEYGEFGKGRLNPKSGSETAFIVEWLTSIEQHYYTYPLDVFPVPVPELDFNIVNAVQFKLDEGSIFIFTRNKTLENEPPIPWLPGTCGPIPLP